MATMMVLSGGFRFRPFLVVIHRYIGLLIATFLVVAALTGSIVVFQPELDRLANASVGFVSPPGNDATALSPLELRAKVERQLPQGYRIWGVPLGHLPAHHSVRFDIYCFELCERRYDTAYADPYSGMLLGLRDSTDYGQARNIVGFLHLLHVELALGDVGRWLLAIAALAWTIDCFIGLFLTFPPSGRRKVARSWLDRWKPSWLFRAGSMFAAIFSFHRAAGLWIWPMLIVLAWSSVALLLPGVYEPVMRTILPTQDGEPLPELEIPRLTPALSWADGKARAETLMAAEAAARGFEIRKPELFAHEPSFGLYRYQVYSSLDPMGAKHGQTTIWLDSSSGKRLAFSAPTGERTGETVDHWLVALHLGNVFGLPYRVFLCFCGLITTGLAVTGLLIWWRKRRSRKALQRVSASRFRRERIP